VTQGSGEHLGQAGTDGELALQLEGVSKSFAGAVALTDVSLHVRVGEVHALLGENGAGKSTLIKIASGALGPDSGSVHVGSERLTRSNPRQAHQLGLRVIHQERQIALDLTVGENVLLDRIPSRAGCVRRRDINARASEQLEALGIDIDPRRPTRELTVADHQLIEIARAVSFDARVVIMDEPTASLHRGEVQALFAIIKRLRERNVAVLFISHHLDEVFAVADRVTVLRDGRAVGTRVAADVTTQDLLELIFGQAVNVSRESVRAGFSSTPGQDVVVANHLAYRRVVKDVSLTMRAGEIVALTGSLGSGASEVAQLLAGAIAPDSGTLALPGIAGGNATRHKGRGALTRGGVAFLPADRKRNGLLLERSVADNILLASLVTSRRPVRLPGADTARALAAAQRLSIKLGNIADPVRTLSGGNQQKTILGRWLEVGSSVLIFDEPTAGVDIASKVELYRCLLDCAASGAAVLIVSSDFEEIRAVADRVLVLRNGVIAGEIDGANADAANLVRLEMGA